MKYLMGIDCGTGSVRVAIFDLRGQNRAYDIAEYPTTYPQNGWAEQDDKDWYEDKNKNPSVWNFSVRNKV